MSERIDSQEDIISGVRKLFVQHANISGSKFVNGNKARNLLFNTIDLSDMKIIDANLSNLEIDGAQMGGAIIHHIGMPPEGHHHHDPNNMKQSPIRFEDCDLNNSTFTRCDLSGVEITECNISGLKINGILIEELLKTHNATK